MHRRLLLASVAFASAALGAASVQAQTTSPPGPSTASTSTGAGAPPPRASAEAGASAAPIASGALPGAQPAPGGAQLNEVVVTAEKRTSTAQKTAASIDVVTSDTLAKQNLVQVQDLNSVLPSVQLLTVVNSIQVDIRGIESNFIGPRSDPAVAVSVNGLFFDRPLPQGFAFLDVSRVEDLNGPQGTLYGRNAVGGALNIITNQPTKELGGSVTAEGGNLGRNIFTGVLNVPVTDTLSVRAAYQRDRRDGYLGGFYDDENTDTARLSALWRPTSKLTVYAEGDYLHQGGHGSVEEAYPCNGAQPYSLIVPGTSVYIPGTTRGVACTDFGGGPIALSGRTNNFINADQVHIDYDLGWATLTSISGFVGTHQRFTNLPNAVVNLNSTRTNNYDYSEEIRLAGHDQANHAGGLAWQVGGFFFDSTGSFVQTTTLAYDNPILFRALGPPTTTDYSGLPQSSEAAFAQATYGVTDRLRVTAGLRYTHDRKGVQQPGLAKLADDEDHVTYKVGAEYDLAPGKLLYANISSGYLDGGPDGGDPNLPVPANRAPVFFKAETITAYEIGSKNRFLNNRLQLNADFYYYTFNNLQVTEPATYNTASKGSALVIENAGGLETYGFEFNGQFALTPNDRFSGSVTIAQGHYDGAAFAETPAGLPTIESIPASQTLINLPTVAALLGYEHVWRLPGGQSLAANINTKISSSYQLEIGSPIIPAFDVQPAYTRTDAGLNYTFHDNKYVIRGYVKNIENTAVNIYGESGGNHAYGVLAPRTYGGSLTVNF